MPIWISCVQQVHYQLYYLSSLCSSSHFILTYWLALPPFFGVTQLKNPRTWYSVSAQSLEDVMVPGSCGATDFPGHGLGSGPSINSGACWPLRLELVILVDLVLLEINKLVRHMLSICLNTCTVSPVITSFLIRGSKQNFIYRLNGLIAIVLLFMTNTQCYIQF